MKTIPKIIHQVWGGDNPLPKHFVEFSGTWKEHHPEWKYEFWDDARIDKFVKEHYPQYYDMFNDFAYNMQRWDTVRYMMMDIYGGIYADFDSECFKPIDELIDGMECLFSLEPNESAKINKTEIQLATAIMGSAPGHPFMKDVIKNIFDNFKKVDFTNITTKVMDVVRSTGPVMLTNSYDNYPHREDINIIPHKYFSYFTHWETTVILSGEMPEEMENAFEKRIEEAYTVHYYFYDWFKGNNEKI